MLLRSLKKLASAEEAGIAGRYGFAVFNAAKESKKLDGVYADLSQLRDLLATDSNFRLFIESPGIKREQRANAINDLCAKIGADKITQNFLSLLIENKRVSELRKVVDAFEGAYRNEKGQVVCVVTSAAILSESDQGRVKQALETRNKDKGELILSFNVNPNIMGGLLVKMGEAVFDFSVSSKVDRLQAQLLAPLGA